MREVRRASVVDAPAPAVWERVASLDGVNDELRPWMRMTAPRGAVLDPAAVPLGRRWFRSWILAFGVVPIDYDDLTVVRIDAGRGFLERSTMLSARVWEHERTLREVPGGRTEVEDRVAFEPRLPGTSRVHAAVVGALFGHRHRRLRRYFSGSSPSTGIS